MKCPVTNKEETSDRNDSPTKEVGDVPAGVCIARMEGHPSIWWPRSGPAKTIRTTCRAEDIRGIGNTITGTSLLKK
ncbi:hypothetical protein ABH924_003617 [Arthrobacter sp. GAS37]